MTIKPVAKKRVRALFEGSAVLFDVPEAATLEQVAAMLAAAGRGHGTPLAVEISTKPIN